MERSPKGRHIEYVEGRPGDIMTRGRQIEDLGQKMLDCADTLKQMKDQDVDDGQRGKAIDSLKDSIGDSHEKLKQAGELYHPVGPVIHAYGEALESAQPRINNATDECEQKWAHYQSLPGDAEGSTTPEAGGGILGMGGHDADSDEAKEEASNNAAKKAAYDAWRESAESFDAGYDSWEDAFDTAVSQVGDKMSGSIKDSFWSTVTDFLEIAAFVIGVAAIIIGGPIMAAIALAVGALLLITTIMSYVNGERSFQDILMAGLGVIPVTKLSNLTKFASMARGGSKLSVLKNVSGLGSLKGLTKAGGDLVGSGKLFRADGLVGIFKNRGAAAGLNHLFTGSATGLRGMVRTHRQFFEGPGLRLASLRNSPVTTALGALDYSLGSVSTTLRNIGLIDKFPGVDIKMPDIPALSFLL